MSSQLDNRCQTHATEESYPVVEKWVHQEDDVDSLLSTEPTSDDEKCRVGVSEDGSEDEATSDGGAPDATEPPIDSDEPVDIANYVQADNDNQQDDIAATAPNFSQEETLLIFDWDDTILPSTWLQLQGLGLDEKSIVSSEQRACLDSLSERVAKTLQTAKQHGTVVFITNAEAGWIELSCQKFLPSLWLFMQSVRFLSARSLYETDDIQCPSMWKLCAFEREIADFSRTLPADQRMNIISFGDALHERDALFRATVQTDCCRKNLKFLEQPDWAVLGRQHEFVSAYFQQIMDHNFSMDLCLRCS